MTAERPRKSETRRKNNLLSVRTDDSLLADLRALAARDGVSPSEWVRRAIAGAALEAGRPAEVSGFRHKGWQCQHVQITAGNAVLGAASCGQGCEMLPLYEALPVAA